MSAEIIPLDPLRLAEHWRAEALQHKADAEMYRAQAVINANTVAKQKCDYGRAIDSAYARERELSRRIEAAAALDLEPEWIVTGDSRYPTLQHLIETAHGDWAGDTPELRIELRERISAIRQSYLSANGKRIVLECFRCGASKASDDCCESHRLGEVMDDRCAACIRMVAEGIGR